MHRVRLNFSSDAAIREEICEAARAHAQGAAAVPRAAGAVWKGLKEAIFQLCA